MFLSSSDESPGGKDMSASGMGKSNVTEKPLFLSTSKEGCADSGSKIEKVPTVHHSKKEKVCADFPKNLR